MVLISWKDGTRYDNPRDKATFVPEATWPPADSANVAIKRTRRAWAPITIVQPLALPGMGYVLQFVLETVE